eukprot:scaffold34_cov260-Pinguiococcus_pyrenoidosus.AAC.37
MYQKSYFKIGHLSPLCLYRTCVTAGHTESKRNLAALLRAPLESRVSLTARSRLVAAQPGDADSRKGCRGVTSGTGGQRDAPQPSGRRIERARPLDRFVVRRRTRKLTFRRQIWRPPR